MTRASSSSSFPRSTITWKASYRSTCSFADTTKFSVIDIGVLMHQIPGGMISNLVSQLKQAKALHRIDEVYEEMPRTRAEMGFPPLVTPTSQIVGVQAVMNVMMGRYKMISKEVKDYFYGLYGKTTAPVNEEIQKKALKGYERGEQPIDCRPGRRTSAGTGQGKGGAYRDIRQDGGHPHLCPVPHDRAGIPEEKIWREVEKK